jgi:hypothetical protein
LNLFLHIDRTAEFKFALNVTDMANTTSYTRKDITTLLDFQIDTTRLMIRFVGNKRRTGYIPGYAFKLKNAKDLDNWKQVFTQVMYEVQTKESYTKNV